MLLETTKVSPENHRSFLFVEPVDRVVCRGDGDPADFFRQAEERLAQGYYLAGWLSYEFGYLLEPALSGKWTGRSSAVLADFGVFAKPHMYDHDTGFFAGAGPWPQANLIDNGPQCPVHNLRLNQQREDYLEKIRAIKSFIESGDTYQVNYTLKLLFDYKGPESALYLNLRRNQSVSYAAYIKNGQQQVLSFSPELFFHKQGNSITVRPMKGTIQRGRTTAEDSELARFLRNDIKNRSENIMIVDLLRNDLGRLSRMGGVRVQSLFDVETYETLHQMTSTISGELSAGFPAFSLNKLFQALFPSGSVTGAPKIRTMEIIRELELEDRGVYTGAIGFLAPDGEAMFNVPIRTLVLEDGRGEMGVGSGIVYDSDPVNEWEECRLKGRFLTDSTPEFKLIETILWRPAGGYWLLEEHLQRLAESARYFNFPLKRENVISLLPSAAGFFGDSGHRLRLLLDKNGDLDITVSECALPALAMATPVTLPPVKVEELPTVVISRLRTDSASPYLFHKTTMRDFYDRERELAVADGHFEVLFLNERGEVTEGSISNVFIRRGDVLVTPPVSCGLLAGVLRRHLLSLDRWDVRESVLTRRDLEAADAVYVGNSVRGLVRVEVVEP